MGQNGEKVSMRKKKATKKNLNVDFLKMMEKKAIKDLIAWKELNNQYDEDI